MRTINSVIRGSLNGPVVVKGSPEKSLLYQKVSPGAMPPVAFVAFKLTLTGIQIETTANGQVNCTRRITSATPLQLLTMPNDEFMVESAKSLAERVMVAVGEHNPSKWNETAYLLALSRNRLGRN